MQSKVLSLPVVLSRESGESCKRQIARQLEWLILSGRLQAGDRLPSINGLVAMLGVSKNTVLAAYALLADAGLINSERSRGFFVAPDGPLRADPAGPDYILTLPPPVYADASHPVRAPGVHACPPEAPIRFDFKVGRPSAHAFPWRRWSALSRHLLRHVGRSMSEYTPAEGLWGLRMQIADYLSATRAIKIEPEQVVIVAGTQEALSLLAAHFLEAGDSAVMESPGYAGFSHVLALHRARETPVPVDEQGLRTELLPERPVRLAYVTPSHQYPLGHTLSMPRRRQLLEWAARTGALVIEDDYDGDFCYESAPLPPLMAMDPLRVVYLGTFSKALGPGLRLGYMVCPRPLAEAIGRRKALLNNGCPWLDQAVMARFFDEGEYSRHMYGLRRRYRVQRDQLLDGIALVWRGEGQVSGMNAGMHVAFQLPADSPPARDVARRALQYGVRLYPLEAAASDCRSSRDERTLLFGYAALEPAEIAIAMAVLGKALARQAVCEDA